MANTDRWFVGASVRAALATGGVVKKIPGYEAWFYTGPTRHFGHHPPKKKRVKGK